MSTTFLGYYPSKYELLGIIFILIAFTLYGVKIGLTSKADLKGFYFAACAGCFIASYSLVDRYGVRIAQNAIAFYSAVTIINGVNFFLLFLLNFNRETFPRLILHGQIFFGLKVQHHS